MRTSRRRRGAITAVSAALVLTAVVSPARGADDPALPFVNGTSKAVANVARAAPGVGSLELGVATGVAISEVRNDLAQAQAQMFDLGLIGIALTVAGCDGDDAYVAPEQLPQPTRVDNRAGDAAAANDQFPLGVPGFGVGRMETRATRQPLADAAATGGVLKIGPAVTVNGGRAQTVSRVVEGKAREARASVEASIDLGGVVQLGGLRWDAVHRTGADPVAAGRFDIGWVAANGVALPADQAAGAEQAINAALVPLGVTVQFPRVERREAPVDMVRITPLRILLKDSPAGAAVLGPVLDATRTGRSDFYDRVTEIDCQLGSFLLVGDITLSVLSGTGFLVVDIGGAEASSAENRFESPFRDDGQRPSGAVEGTTVDEATVAAGAGTAPSGDAGPSTVTRPGTEAAALRTTSEARCESAHPFRWPPCSRGAAVPLGLLAVLAVVAVAALDWRHQRRRAATP